MHRSQDIVLTVGNILFIIALIPSLRQNSKPAFVTSTLTAAVLFVFSGTYMSLHLYLAAAVTLVGGMTWLTLAWQKYSQAKR